MSTPRKRPKTQFILGLIIGILLIIGIEWGAQVTSKDSFCDSCHIHPHATQTWKSSPHYDNNYGVTVHCVDCHLPPKTSYRYYSEKAITGVRDVYGKLFKDPQKLNWEEKSEVEQAIRHTYEESCIECHQNLFPIGLSQEGEDAHLYYDQTGNVNCLNCHVRAGHYTHAEQHAEEYKIEKKTSGIIYRYPARVDKFESYTEYIPGTSVKFDMIAIAAGAFKLGSPESEPCRDDDEGPQVSVEISPFWMAKTELTWNEFDAFYAATAKEGRSDTRSQLDEDVDGITGPTPPYQNPDQGWGRASRPAITMTYYTATVYCDWLSQVTGKRYRLPTEAEWEYACRGGTETPYFFPGDPKKYTSDRLWNKIFGVDTTTIASYVNYDENSLARTVDAHSKKENPYGLLNMAGNVWEFCSDWYAPDAYKAYANGIKDPTGPASSQEHVIRGGSYKSDAAEARSAARAATNHDAWMVTDPQMPKSTWWYSDSKEVGFRVVCEYNEH
ncbi:SUMF1/EgtB/PvdO family nonheme iron enzyme [candidate division KSB1 bacterium]|nr:SUMF1/EgtB/PvdO family nonheme iron enzyme [candidate division KSB1 bacterium]RQW02274.1 MAG: hypothetical protein EH222_13900 [candidate division KSB1 bacterium]